MQESIKLILILILILIQSAQTSIITDRLQGLLW